jgi:hypothetical protein
VPTPPRARYLEVFEDHCFGGGSFVVDCAIERIERVGDGWRVHAEGTTEPGSMVFDVDEVIATTGFGTPLGDLRALGVKTFYKDRLPTQTPFWESSTVPGIFFAGTIDQAQAGLKKHGIPPNSGAVHGARYNARVLARYIATTKFGVQVERPMLTPGDVLPFVLDELTRGPEIWHQRAHLARVLTVDPDSGIRDEGIMPLSAFLDDGPPTALAATLEADGTSAIFPTIYLRRDGRVSEHLMTPHPLLDYETEDARKQLAEILGGVIPSYASVYSGTR